MLFPKSKSLKQINGETGEVETTLKGGERIFSIPNTTELVATAKKANSVGEYKALGLRVIEILNKQDSTQPEYV